MTTAGDIYREIDRIAPFSLAQDWDNSGFLCGDREAPVRRVMAALDATMDVVREAAQKDCQMILTHHPVIFHPLRSVTPQEVAYHAVRAGIAIVCAHTNLDAAYGGVNEVLARRLALAGLEPLEDEPVPISIGTDASEVSHTVPLITISAATMCLGTPLHHWAAARQAGMSIGHKGMLYAARCMAEGTLLWLGT